MLGRPVRFGNGGGHDRRQLSAAARRTPSAGPAPAEDLQQVAVLVTVGQDAELAQLADVYARLIDLRAELVAARCPTIPDRWPSSSPIWPTSARTCSRSGTTGWPRGWTWTRSSWSCRSRPAARALRRGHRRAPRRGLRAGVRIARSHRLWASPNDVSHPSQDGQVRLACSMHHIKRDRTIEGDKPTVMTGGHGQQVGVGHLTWTDQA